jgi:hypothetical protein
MKVKITKVTTFENVNLIIHYDYKGDADVEWISTGIEIDLADMKDADKTMELIIDQVTEKAKKQKTKDHTDIVAELTTQIGVEIDVVD